MINSNVENKIFSNIKMARNIKNFKNDGNKKRKLILSKLNIKLNVNGQFSVDDKRKVGLKKDATNKEVYDKLKDHGTDISFENEIKKPEVKIKKAKETKETKSSMVSGQ